MFNIWNSVEMETVVSYVNKKFIVQFAETIIDDKIIQYGPAGVSKFNKALNIMKTHPPKIALQFLRSVFLLE